MYLQEGRSAGKYNRVERPSPSLLSNGLLITIAAFFFLVGSEVKNAEILGISYSGTLLQNMPNKQTGF